MGIVEVSLSFKAPRVLFGGKGGRAVRDGGSWI